MTVLLQALAAAFCLVASGAAPAQATVEFERAATIEMPGVKGRIDVIRQETPDRYVPEGSVLAAPFARTGLLVPEEGKLYVAAPADGATPARIFAYRLR